MSGETSYHAGLAAEEIVLGHYRDRGAELRATRWRGKGGEVDLIVALDGVLVFVEVKKSRSFDRAALRLSERQMARLYAAASEFIAGEPAGQLTDMRFDAALVNDAGAVQIIENAFGH